MEFAIKPLATPIFPGKSFNSLYHFILHMNVVWPENQLLSNQKREVSVKYHSLEREAITIVFWAYVYFP